MILLSHPTGNEFVRAALAAFDCAGMLGEFWTTLSWNSKSPINLALPRRLREILQRRSFPATIRARTRTIPRREIIRLFAGTVGLASKHETGAFSIDAVLRELDGKVADRLRKIEPHAAVDSVYAYEDGALESFRAARDGGFRRIYDLPIAYWQTSRRLLLEEAERYPDWEPTLGATRDSDEKLSRKTQELQLANLVVCPSRFVLESLPPHGEVLRLMQSCDVFILPSIVEGRALVQQEAMACGIPVIATKNAGADDVIVDGETGFLVPIRSPEALAEKISWCVANRALVDGMGIAAGKRAAEFTWRAYGESIVAAVRALTCQ